MVTSRYPVAQVLAGGHVVQHTGGGQFFAPTVLVNITPEMRIWRYVLTHANSCVCSFVCLSVRLSVCLSVCLFIHSVIDSILQHVSSLRISLIHTGTFIY